MSAVQSRLNGLEFCRRRSEDPALADVPVVVLLAVEDLELFGSAVDASFSICSGQ